MSVLTLLLWIVSLRRLSDLVYHTYLTGWDVLSYVGQLKHDKVRLRPVRQGVDKTRLSARYEEQDEITRSINALTEIAIRSLEHRERIAAREAMAALGKLDELASTTRLPIGWGKFHGSDKPRYDWLQVYLVEAVESVTLAAAELHYFSVASICAKRLHEIGCRVTGGDWPQPEVVTRRLLGAFEYSIDECVVAGEQDLRDILLDAFRELLARIPCGSRLWQDAVHENLRNHIVGMLLRSVVTDELASLRAATTCLSLIAQEHSAAEDQITDAVDAITDAAFNLGATAYASRAYSTASAMTDFAAIYFDRRGFRFSAQARKHWESPSEPPPIPKYVTMDYFRIFLVVAAARSLAISQPGWSPDAIETARQYGTALVDWKKRAEVTIRRMASKVAYPPDEVADWVKALKKLA